VENEKNGLINDEMSEKIIAAAEAKIASGEGDSLSVSMLLRELNITNRVFYNRFPNLDEVLGIVYRRTVVRMREGMSSELTDDTDFFKYVTDVVVKTLVLSYETKMRLGNYIFENDTDSRDNYEWWMTEIKKLLEYAVSRRLIREVDTDIMSYAIWCFCRGFNADAVLRSMPKDEAVKKFRYGFGILLDGLRAGADTNGRTAYNK